MVRLIPVGWTAFVQRALASLEPIMNLDIAIEQLRCEQVTLAPQQLHAVSKANPLCTPFARTISFKNVSEIPSAPPESAIIALSYSDCIRREESCNAVRYSNSCCWKFSAWFSWLLIPQKTPKKWVQPSRLRPNMRFSLDITRWKQTRKNAFNTGRNVMRRRYANLFRFLHMC